MALYHVDLANVQSEKEFFQKCEEVFSFPSYFGHNWDALEECLGDMLSAEDAFVTIVLDNFEQIRHAEIIDRKYPVNKPCGHYTVTA